VADAAIPWGGLGIFEAGPADWANVTRLASGALELGPGLIITASALLAAHEERARVLGAISKFDLDPTNAADVLAASAYVWAKDIAPLPAQYPEVAWGGPQNESVAQSIMALELARPGTLALAVDGFDKQSKRYLDAAVEDGMKGGAIFESRPRPANLPAALQTTISSARAALNLKTNDQMQAHHLIPTNVWENRLVLATLAGQAGWQPESEKNLIALPANEAAQAELAASMEGRIRAGEWMPKLR
jgi:hypothetical protein